MPQRLKTGLRRSAHASIKAHSARLASQQFPLEEDPQENDLEHQVTFEQTIMADSLGRLCDQAHLLCYYTLALKTLHAFLVHICF